MISVGKSNYTVWIFYLISDESVYGTEPNDIYAYTTDMELASQFTSQRNMDKFYMRKIKMNNEQLNQLYKDYMDEDHSHDFYPLCENISLHLFPCF